MRNRPVGPTGRARDSLHLLSRVVSERRPSRFFCSSIGRTTRKPTCSALVSHQIDFGACGSSLIQSVVLPTRVAERHLSASSFHEPPRTTCEKRVPVGLFTGCSVGLSLGKSA